jgi:3-phenylpropionate/trans-cinnamate dioxygenase ferredoxin reductase subunit
MNKLVVVGAGHSAGHLLAELQKRGYPGEITLIGAEAHLPYQRPPLSKAFLDAAGFDEARLHLRGASFYTDAGIKLKLNTSVASIDRASRTLLLADGGAEPYDHLVLATGARARELPAPGRHLKRIGTLRGLDDAKRLRAELADCRNMVIVGGGFIGLEIASTASKRGIHVTLLEGGPRLLSRNTSPFISGMLQRAHQDAGVDIRMQAQVQAFEGNETVEAVVCANGERFPADLVVIGIGSEPEIALAQAAGLEADRNGIVVDHHTRSSDPAIQAIGDCAAIRDSETGLLLRLESVQCALDQAVIAAALLCGDTLPPKTVPWFWSEQHQFKLQIAGLAAPDDLAVVRGVKDSDAFSEFYVRNGQLVAIAALNRPADAAVVRKALSAGPVHPDLIKLADPAVALTEALA